MSIRIGYKRNLVIGGAKSVSVRIKRDYVSSIMKGARHYFMSQERETPIEDGNPYIQYPLVTKEQMKRITNDKFKFDFAYTSYAHHSTDSDPMIHSLSDLTEPTQLTSLLPRRRPHGSPSDTLWIKAGDDAMLVSPTVLAIADGVSGWESKGKHCSSGIWSRSMVETLSRLMTEYKLNHVPHHLNKRDIDQILDDSYLHVTLDGPPEIEGFVYVDIGYVKWRVFKDDKHR